MNAIELIEWIKENALFLDGDKLEIDDAEIFKAESLVKEGHRGKFVKYQKEFYKRYKKKYERR